MAPTTILHKRQISVYNEIDDMNDVPYRQAVGSLMFTAIVSRTDMLFAVSQVSCSW